MKNIKRVLAVINQIDEIDLILAKAFSMAKKVDAKVDVLYVHEVPLFDIDELFKLEENSINIEQIKKRIKEILVNYTQEDVAILVKIDDTKDRVWEFVRDDSSVLIVAKYHKDIDLSSLKQPLLIVKNGNLNYTKCALALDTLDNSKELINKAKEFCSSCDLLFNYYLIVDTAIAGAEVVISVDNNLELIEAEQKAFEKVLTENSIDGKFFINFLSDDKKIDEYIKEQGYDLLCYKEESAILNEVKELENLDIFRL